MLRRLTLALLVLAFAVAFAVDPAAQIATAIPCPSFPCIGTLLWDPVPVEKDTIDGYKVLVDNVLQNTLPGQLVNTSPVSIASSGAHVLSVISYRGSSTSIPADVKIDASPIVKDVTPPTNARFTLAVLPTTGPQHAPFNDAESNIWSLRNGDVIRTPAGGEPVRVGGPSDDLVRYQGKVYAHSSDPTTVGWWMFTAPSTWTSVGPNLPQQ